MIIPGRVALKRNVITHWRSVEHQTQPCGIDLTLRKVMNWSSAGTIDFDNTHRKTAETTDVPFETGSLSSGINPEISLPSNQSVQHASPAMVVEPHSEYVNLRCGSYLIEFNEMVHMPLDLMGQILVRSSLFRSGAVVTAGVMDSGHKGAVGAMLQVVNPHGLRLIRSAKLAQMIFHDMSEPVEGYSGVYQGRTSV